MAKKDMAKKESIYKISVILPTYNEMENIAALIRETSKYCGKHLHEIIVVDDNSPDGTWKIASDLRRKNRKIKLIRRINERGLPSAIWAGIRHAKGNVVLWLDCDLSHPPSLISKMIPYLDKYDIVSASRYVDGGRDKRPFFRQASSKMINFLAGLVLNLGVADITSGFYLVKTAVFRKVTLKQTGYAEYCIRLSYDAIRNNFHWKEIPYTFTDREKGTSKSFGNIFNFMKNGYLCLAEIIKLKFSK